MSKLPKQEKDPNLLVGFGDADDAGVYLLQPDLALVQTVDFFTPIVDDAFDYGRIAALNSLNDLWAMGAKPLTALSITCFPKKGLDYDVLTTIMSGGIEILSEKRVSLLGGHSVDNDQIMFGYAVTGVVKPDQVITNSSALPGEMLLLTKPIGTGVISTGVKFQKADPLIVKEALTTMLLSGEDASLIMKKYGVRSATDVTGFGLLGHLWEMANASKINLEIDSKNIPLLQGALEMVDQKMLTRGDRVNREFVGQGVSFDATVSDQLKSLLFDPQTAGGILMTAPKEKVDAILSQLCRKYGQASVIGRVCNKNVPSIHVR